MFIKMTTTIFDYTKRHKKTTLILFLYLIWWSFIFYFFLNMDSLLSKPMCGAAGAGLLMMVVGPFLACLLTSFLFAICSKGENKKDYFIAFFIVLIPFFVDIVDIAM
jgi:hypothetical protein